MHHSDDHTINHTRVSLSRSCFCHFIYSQSHKVLIKCLTSAIEVFLQLPKSSAWIFFINVMIIWIEWNIETLKEHHGITVACIDKACPLLKMTRCSIGLEIALIIEILVSKIFHSYSNINHKHVSIMIRVFSAQNFPIILGPIS